MSNDRREEVLFSGFDSLVPPLAASRRAVEQTRRSLLAPNVRQPYRMRPIAAYCAAAALLASVLAASIVVTRTPRKQTAATNNSAQQLSSTELIAGNEGDSTPRNKVKEIHQMAAYIVPHTHAISAERAPIIVANGGKEPIRLGSMSREGGGCLHVWDWSKSPISRVLPDVEFWGTERVALSPDGKLLVWARGDILNLETAEKTRIDLGGADVKFEESTYGRIGDMQFSPDGGRLAIFVTNLDAEIPGRIVSQTVQVIEFPSGRVMCEFPPGEQYSLRIGFSPNGRRVALADAERQVLLRDATTGEVLQRLLPELASQVMGVAISRDGRYIAATQREPGDLFIWEADSGRLMHRIDGGDPRKNGGPSYGVLRFSPDGNYLAAEMGRLVVFDVAAGKAFAALNVFAPANIQWSADGERLTAVSPVVVGRDWTPSDETAGGREDRYPEIETWDWRNKRRTTGDSRATGKR